MEKIILNPLISKDFISKLNDYDIYKEIIELEDNSNYKLDKNLHIPQNAVEYCLGRKNDLINLALAQVTRNRDSLKLIYYASNDATKYLVLSNPNLKGLIDTVNREKTFFDEYSFESFLKNAPDNHLYAYFSNRCFELMDFENLFLKKAEYEKIPEEKWEQLLSIVSNNENIKSNNALFGDIRHDQFGNAEDGHTWYLRRKAEDAPIALFGLLNPKSQKHCSILERLYEKIAFKTQVSNDWLDKTFEKWRFSNDIKEETDSSFHEDDINRLRNLISFKICEYDENYWNYFRTNPDKHLRYGYYRIYQPTLESIQQHYEKDKETFILAGVDNNNFYLTNTDEQKAITKKFKGFKDEIENNFYIDTQYNYKKTTLARAYPRYYTDELNNYDLSDYENFEEELIQNTKSLIKSIDIDFQNSDDNNAKDDYKLNHTVLHHLNHSLKQQGEILNRLSSSNEINNKLNHLSKSQDNLRYLLVFVIIVLIILAFFML